MTTKLYVLVQSAYEQYQYARNSLRLGFGFAVMAFLAVGVVLTPAAPLTANQRGWLLVMAMIQICIIYILFGFARMSQRASFMSLLERTGMLSRRLTILRTFVDAFKPSEEDIRRKLEVHAWDVRRAHEAKVALYRKGRDADECDDLELCTKNVADAFRLEEYRRETAVQDALAAFRDAHHAAKELGYRAALSRSSWKQYCDLKPGSAEMVFVMGRNEAILKE